MRFCFLLVFCGLLFSSCSRKIDFTQSLRNDLEQNGVSLSSIQYYTSNEFSLRKADPIRIDMGVENCGKLEFQGAGGAPMIYVQSNTPGTCTSVEGRNRVGISFEYGKHLDFVSDSSELAYGIRYMLRPDMNVFGERIPTSDSYTDFEKHHAVGPVYLQVKRKTLQRAKGAKGQVLEGTKVCEDGSSKGSSNQASSRGRTGSGKPWWSIFDKRNYSSPTDTRKLGF